MSRRDSGPTHTGKHGFTLLELSIVLALIGIIIGMGLVTLTSSLQASQFNTTVARMDAIENALFNFAVVNSRIPCPSNLTQTASSATYGLEAGAGAGSSPATATGACTGASMVPQANFMAVSGTVEGGVPTRALQLPDDYMYDGWGRRLRYAVDPTFTAANTLPTTVASSCSNGGPTSITVNDASGAVRTAAAMYALISQGANGHGAYTNNGVTLNAGSVNADELTNCHCTSTGASNGTYTPTYVEKVPRQNASNALDNFDDIVTFKDGWQLQKLNYPLSTAVPQCVYVTDSNNYRVEEDNIAKTYSSNFGSSGAGNGQFSWPEGIAISASGNIAVADRSNNRVERFDSYGSYKGQFGSAGSGNGQFSSPIQVAMDNQGNIWVADYGNNRAEKFDATGNYLAATSGHLNGPDGIATDASNNIWVADWNDSILVKFDSGGNYVAQFSTLGSGNGQLHNPAAVAVDASSNIWVVDYSNNRVEEFSSSGVYVGQFGSFGSGNGQFNGPLGIAIDANGNMWVVDNGNNRVQEFTSSGIYISQYGTTGSGNNQFNAPRYIAISR